MLLELGSLTWLCHVVAFHVVCWAVFYPYVSLGDLVGNKKIPIVDVSGSLAHAFVAILFQLDRTGIILQYNSGLGGISLFFQEILCP